MNAIYDDPRMPTDVYIQGHRTRDMARAELLAAGYSQAEAWSIYHAQWHTWRNPLAEVVDAVLAAKVELGLPLLTHERRELRRRMVAGLERVLMRKGAAWFDKWHGVERRLATAEGTLCADDIAATAR